MNLPDWSLDVLNGAWMVFYLGIYLSIFPILERAFQKNFVLGLLILIFPVVGGIWLWIAANKGTVPKVNKLLFQICLLGTILLKLIVAVDYYLLT